jgi:hypothetical protein
MRVQFGGLISSLSWADGNPVSPIRCVGNYNESKVPAWPRSHHKFLVFGKMKTHNESDEFHSFMTDEIIPTTVWTGSFNLTKNATMSLENAIILSDKSGQNEIIKSYLDTYMQVFSISESLDWEHIWCEPEYRIGT